MKTSRISLVTAALAGIVAFSGTASAGPVETLERERAIVLETQLAPNLTAEERIEKTASAQRRLVDLERIVLRDKSLAEQNTAIVRKAFENYDLTFLVHASTEGDKTIVDHWLEKVQISTATLMNTRVGRR